MYSDMSLQLTWFAERFRTLLTGVDKLLTTCSCSISVVRVRLYVLSKVAVPLERFATFLTEPANR